MKVIYDTETSSAEDVAFNRECVEKSVSLGKDLINIWEEEEFQ